MQRMPGTRSRVEAKVSLYLFAHFSVTKGVETSGNTLLEADGGELSCGALFAQVCARAGKGPLPQRCGTAGPEAAQSSPRAQGQGGRVLCSPAWLLCLPRLHPILFTRRI